MPTRGLALVALAMGLPGCLERRLDVEVTTHVYADGSCLRRTEYHLERSGEDERPPEREAALDDPLGTLHRFPSGEPWEVTHSRTPTLHTTTVEGLLPTCDIAWDYWRVKAPGAALAAQNRFSFAAQGEEGSERTYDYLETFVDPASPLAATRRLIELIAGADGAFADRFRRAVGSAAPRAGDVRRAFRDRLVAPATRQLAEIAERGIYGPRETRDLELAMESLATDLEAALIERSRPAPPAEVRKAAEEALEAALEPALERVAKEGWQAFELFGSTTLRFKVTLIMPAPVVRANACIQGDTVTWEFGQDDLYGRGFEMWARAVQP